MADIPTPTGKRTPIVVWAVVGLALGVGGLLWYRHGKAGAASAAAGTSTQDQFADPGLGGGGGSGGGSDPTMPDPTSLYPSTAYAAPQSNETSTAPVSSSAPLYAPPPEYAYTGGYSTPAPPTLNTYTHKQDGILNPSGAGSLPSYQTPTYSIQPVGGFRTVTF